MLLWSSDRSTFHTVSTGFAAYTVALLSLGRRCCGTLLPFSLKWQPNIATTQKVNPPIWREHFPTPPSPPRFAAEIGVCHRAHPRSAAALTIESLPPLNHEKRRHWLGCVAAAAQCAPPKM